MAADRPVAATARRVAPPERPPPVPRLLVAASVLVVLVVVAVSAAGSGAELAGVRGSTVRAELGAVRVDAALRLTVELRNDGPPVRLAAARLRLVGAQQRAPLRPSGTRDPTVLPRGAVQLATELVEHCGPDGPLAPFGGTVLVRLEAGRHPLELEAELPRERARETIRRRCLPVSLAARPARSQAGPREVRLELDIRTRPSSHPRRVSAVTFEGRPAEVLGTELPVSAGIPGLETVTSLRVLVPASCAPPGELVVVLDEEPVVVPVDGSDPRDPTC